MSCRLLSSGIHGPLCITHAHPERFRPVVYGDGCKLLIAAALNGPLRDMSVSQKIAWARSFGAV